MGQDLGLLLLRAGAGLMMAGHGLGKVADLFSGNTAFADPIGIGPVPSLVLAVFAEFVCALAVVAGFKTRWAAVPLVITMAVAAFVFHFSDPWSTKENAVLFLLAFLVLLLTGAGRYSIDGLMERKRRH